MFGKVPNVNLVAKTYKSSVKTGINMPEFEIRLEDTVNHDKVQNRIQEIMHKMSMGYDVMYDEYLYVLEIDPKLGRRIDNYRKYRHEYSTKLYSLDHDSALEYYKKERRRTSDYDPCYYKAVDLIWYEYLRREKEERISTFI